MLVAAKAMQCASHAQLGIKWFRPKDEYPLPGRFRRNRAVRVIGIWFSARPAGDCMLQFVKDTNVERVSRAGFKSSGARPVPCSLRHVI